MKANYRIHLVFLIFLMAFCSSVFIGNAHAQWTQFNYNLFGKRVICFTVSGDTIFAGTGYSNGIFSGIQMSTNNGNSWVKIFSMNDDIYSIVVSGNNIYAACGSSGIYLSTNRGINWASLGFNNARCIAVSGNTLFTGSTYGGGVYLSTNNGANWIQTSLNNCEIWSLAASGSTVYAGARNSGIYLSTNNGISWNQTSIPNGTVNNFLISGSNVYAGMEQYGSRVYMTTNNGTNWSSIGFNNNVLSLAISGNNLFAGTYGVYITTNNGINWTQSLFNQNVFGLSVSGSKVFAGGNSGYFTTTNNGQTWETPPPSSIGALIQFGNNLFAGTTVGVYISTDGGIRWAYKNLLQNTISLLKNGSYVFAGTAGAGVYYTTNDGVNWTQTSLNNQTVYALALKGSSILAATANGVYYSTNNGTNWTPSSLTGISTKALYVLDSLVYAGTVFSGVYKSSDNGINWAQTSLIYLDVNSLTSIGSRLYAGTGGSGVYYTDNNGTNWTQTSFNNNTIISFSTYGSSLFAGTSGSGVYLTKNAGVNWSQVNDGMGNQGVGALCTYGNYIVAGTGFGIWRRYILEFAPIRGDANLDSTVNVQDVTSIVNYILGNPPVPFSTLAADVNTDLVINVLDVVGTVNIILHPTIKQFANKENNDRTGYANLYIENNNLKLFSTMPVRGIQFNLSGTNAQNVAFTPSSELMNYQVVSNSKYDTSRIFVIFSDSDTALTAGSHTLGTLSGLTGGILMNNIFIADENGNGIITGIKGNEESVTPKDYSLNQNYPNPFNPVTTIYFELPRSGVTTLKIYDVTGRLVKTLVNEYRQAGYYKTEFDASALASGVYFYRLSSGDFVSARKMIVLK